MVVEDIYWYYFVVLKYSLWWKIFVSDDVNNLIVKFYVCRVSNFLNSMWR